MSSADRILDKLGLSLTEVSDVLPSSSTTTAHILEVAECLAANNGLEAFHHLSLTHSTTLFHGMSQKLLQQHTNIFGKNMKRPTSSEETLNILKSLPSDWTLIQITSEGKISGDANEWRKAKDTPITPNLYVSRCRCGPSSAVVVQKILSPTNKFQVKGFLEELISIKGENKVINNYYKEDRTKFFLKRQEINDRMKRLVMSMEVAWLRHWSSIFQGSLPAHEELKLHAEVLKILKDKNINISEDKITRLQLMISTPLVTMASSDVKGYTHEFPLRVGVAAVLGASVRSQNVIDLTKVLKELQDNLAPMRKLTRNPIILILDKAVTSMPWEMLSVMKDQPVTRMPSLYSLHILYLYHSQKEDSIFVQGINPEKGFYVLDPDNNLPLSRERLSDTFDNTGWDGVTCKSPTPEEFKEAISTKDIFVYSGHGAGSKYLPGQLVESVECRSMVLLYGCSSARLIENGIVPDPWGVLLNYIITLSPCVVGMLWEVMDRDTDLLTKEMVRGMMGEPGSVGSPLEDPPSDISLLVAKARPLCSWYLISAALVVYGLPLHILHSR